MVNTPLLALEDSGDWMRVLVVPPGASPEDIETLWAKYVPTTEGEGTKEETLWALRQQGDMMYLVSFAFVVIFLRMNAQNGTSAFRGAVCCWA